VRAASAFSRRHSDAFPWCFGQWSFESSAADWRLAISDALKAIIAAAGSRLVRQEATAQSSILGADDDALFLSDATHEILNRVHRSRENHASLHLHAAKALPR
jgi:hypothetical protein